MAVFARASSVFVAFSDHGEAKSDRKPQATRRRARTEELHAAFAIAPAHRAEHVLLEDAEDARARVTLESGAAVHVPMRVLPNGTGSEVVLMVVREQGSSDEKFAWDAHWVERDLNALKRLLEGWGARPYRVTVRPFARCLPVPWR
jgi:hypothetical protein